MPLMKFTGNYVEVIDALALPAFFYSPYTTVEGYTKQIKKDLPRTAYASFSSTSDELKRRLSPIDNLTAYVYTQGDYDGGGVTIIQVQSSKPHIAYLESTCPAALDVQNLDVQNLDVQNLDVQNSAPEKFMDTVRLCYVDDGGAINAFAVTYLRDDSDLTIQESQRPRLFAAVVIQNIAAVPQERTVHYFANKTLLSEQSINSGVEISDSAFVEQLVGVLNSRHLSTVIEHIFDGEHLSLHHFNALSARILHDRNIDNRDTKQLCLEHFNQFAHERLLTNAPQLQQELEQIKEDAVNDANFFADEQFNQRLINIYQKIDTVLDDNDLKAMNKLNLWIIQLQLRASLCTSDQAFKQQALNLQVQRLLAIISEPDTALHRYHNLEFGQVEAEINKAESRVHELHERAQPFKALYTGSAFTALMNELKSTDFFNEDAFQQTLTYFSEQVPQLVEAKIKELHQSLVQQVQAQALHLQAVALVANDLPEFIREALFSKVAIMEQQIASLTPLELAKKYADVPINQVIEGVFLTLEQQQTQQIADEAKTRVKQLPVAEAPKADTRSFFSRNLVSLGAATAGILLTAGLILIATGVLAPIGIALAGLALIATIVAAALTATVVVGAGIKIAHDEDDRTNDFDLATQVHNNYNNDLKLIETEKQTQLDIFSTDLHEHKERVKDSISSIESQNSKPAVAEEGLLQNGVEVDSLQSLLQLIDQHLNDGQQQVNVGGEIFVAIPQYQPNEPALTTENVDDREHNPNENLNSASRLS